MVDLNKFSSGVNTSFSSELNSNFSEAYRLQLLNTISQLQDRSVTFSADGGIYAEAYIDADGRLGSVDTVNTTATFDTDKYAIPGKRSLYIFIEADDATVNWSSNDTSLIKYDTGKWFLSYIGTGDDEVARAQIHKSLWYGTDGSNPLILDFSNVTAIKSNDSRDIGKKGLYLTYSVTSRISGGNATFAFDSGTNSDCSVWSYLQAKAVNSYSSGISVQFPLGTTVNSIPVGRSVTTTYDEIGTDTSAEEQNTPSNIYVSSSNSTGYERYSYARIICLSSAGVTVSTSAGANSAIVDFNTDNSIPFISDGSSEDVQVVIAHDIPSGTFSSTFQNSFATAKIVDWEDGANIQFKLTNATEDTGYGDYNEVLSAASAFTSEPTKLWVKLVPKSSSPTAGYPSIYGVGCIGDR